MTPPRHATASGFTLLELLVALVVFGLLMAGLAQGVRFGLTAWGAQSRMIARDADLDAVERVLRRLLDGVEPGRPVDPPNIVGTAASLAFTSDLPEGAAGTASERHADILLRVADARLVLRWVPHLHVRRLAPPPAPVETELLHGIDRLDLAYWDEGGQWRTAWRDRTPPRLIRLRLRFAPGDPRHWPDIVVAPRVPGDS
jgi:general secretion pathway protein J